MTRYRLEYAEVSDRGLMTAILVDSHKDKTIYVEADLVENRVNKEVIHDASV